MDASSLEELVFDSSKCSKLSLEQKRVVVYELSKWSDGAADILQAWSRQDILQILCAELGKERKYTGLTKLKIIEHLLKVVSDKKSLEQGTASLPERQPLLDNGEMTPKRQRKSDNPSHLLSAANTDASNIADGDLINTTYCKNSACKAKLNREDVFCKRCSCCICRQYDDNKDPSLWLVCGSDPPFQGKSCGMSCHLECALRHEKSGITNNRQDKGLDGNFCCVSCGKVNDLLGSWRKQLTVASNTRRVDILCYRLSLSRKILAGTKHYKNLYGIIDEAVKKLEEDVGPLTGLPVKTARGIVNRLSSGPEVQRLCASSVDSLNSIISNRESDIPSGTTMLAAKLVRFEDNNIREREMHQAQFQTGNSQSEVANINSTNVEVEQSQSPATNCSALSNPSSVEDETNNVMPCSNMDKTRGDNYVAFRRSDNKSSCANFLYDTINFSESQKETSRDVVSFLDKEQKQNNDALNLKNKDTSKVQMVEKMSTGNLSNIPSRAGLEWVPYVDSSENGLPITPCKLENAKDGNGRNNNRPKRGGRSVDNASAREKESSKKKFGERDEDCTEIGDKNFEYYVKVIRWLECDDYIETTFRQKFLTWYSLTATPQEVRVVKVFIDTFIEDPASLAGQLVDTFSDVISNKKRCSTVPSGFCLKLWH
ncbi:VIN3-like protein 2 isoform X2 [Olea europaea var. sylvestris]|uniref:VIN3-like protein 2 isoform X2 n=1 Tax=Olea europaea var. sylvestris TaxID=158386 RepID=UPI000C1CF0B8|nr:VIN3-like protein 2 isoform X2 [Olea europaea var. sylvestris]